MVIKSANRQIRIPKYREFPGSQWLGLHTFTAEVLGFNPRSGKQDPTSLAAQPKTKTKKKKPQIRNVTDQQRSANN